MYKVGFIASAIITTTLLSGCATTGQNNRYTSSAQQQADASCSVFSQKMIFSAGAGALGGAALGAAIGGKYAGTGSAIGAGVGLLLGGIIGKINDNSDCEAALVALKAMDTAPVNMPITWSNPETGNRGDFTPTSTPAIDKASGKLCRTYQQKVTRKSGEQSKEQSGLTCRNENGDWQLVA